MITVITAYELIKFAKTQIGVKENPVNSNNVKYNTWYYGRPVSGSAYPWCCVLISYAFDQMGAKELIKKTASCMEMAQWFKDHKQWHTNPKIGDIVFFKFGTNNRWTNHVGLVIDVQNGFITTIEGNTSINSNDNGGSVMKRTRNMANVVGFGRPKYGIAETMTTLVTDATQYPTLKKGSKGQYTTILQQKLNENGAKLIVDGVFGSLTEIALISYQKTHNDKSGVRLVADGICGIKTWQSIL